MGNVSAPSLPVVMWVGRRPCLRVVWYGDGVLSCECVQRNRRDDVTLSYSDAQAVMTKSSFEKVDESSKLWVRDAKAKVNLLKLLKKDAEDDDDLIELAAGYKTTAPAADESAAKPADAAFVELAGADTGAGAGVDTALAGLFSGSAGGAEADAQSAAMEAMIADMVRKEKQQKAKIVVPEILQRLVYMRSNRYQLATDAADTEFNQARTGPPPGMSAGDKREYKRAAREAADRLHEPFFPADDVTDILGGTRPMRWDAVEGLVPHDEKQPDNEDIYPANGALFDELTPQWVEDNIVVYVHGRRGTPFYYPLVPPPPPPSSADQLLAGKMAIPGPPWAIPVAHSCPTDAMLAPLRGMLAVIAAREEGIDPPASALADIKRLGGNTPNGVDGDEWFPGDGKIKVVQGSSAPDQPKGKAADGDLEQGAPMPAADRIAEALAAAYNTDVDNGKAGSGSLQGLMSRIRGASNRRQTGGDKAHLQPLVGTLFSPVPKVGANPTPKPAPSAEWPASAAQAAAAPQASPPPAVHDAPSAAAVLLELQSSSSLSSAGRHLQQVLAPPAAVPRGEDHGSKDRQPPHVAAGPTRSSSKPSDSGARGMCVIRAKGVEGRFSLPSAYFSFYNNLTAPLMPPDFPGGDYISPACQCGALVAKAHEKEVLTLADAPLPCRLQLEKYAWRLGCDSLRWRVASTCGMNALSKTGTSSSPGGFSPAVEQSLQSLLSGKPGSGDAQSAIDHSRVLRDLFDGLTDRTTAQRFLQQDSVFQEAGIAAIGQQSQCSLLASLATSARCQSFSMDWLDPVYRAADEQPAPSSNGKDSMGEHDASTTLPHDARFSQAETAADAEAESETEWPAPPDDLSTAPTFDTGLPDIAPISVTGITGGSAFWEPRSSICMRGAPTTPRRGMSAVLLSDGVTAVLYGGHGEVAGPVYDKNIIGMQMPLPPTTMNDSYVLQVIGEDEYGYYGLHPYACKRSTSELIEMLRALPTKKSSSNDGNTKAVAETEGDFF